MSANSVYALLARNDHAHEEKIYAGVWAQITVANQKHVFLVTGGLDRLVKVWQWEYNKLDLIHTLEGHKMGILSIAVSPDGHTIASVSLDETLIIWELLSGNKVHQLDSNNNSYWASAFSPTGEYLAVAGYTGQIVVIKVAKSELVKKIDTRANANGRIVCVAWSPDGKRLAAGTVDGNVQMYDMERDCLKYTVHAHKDLVRSVAFSAKSNLLATASTDGLVKVYNVLLARGLMQSDGKRPDGMTLIPWKMSRPLVQDITKNAALKGTLDHKCWVLSVCFSKDGTRIATGDDRGMVRVARSRPLSQKHGDSDDESTGQTTMTSISNGNVRTVEVASGKSGPESLELEVLHVFKEHTQAAWAVQFSPDQTKLLSVSKDQSINIYEIPALKKK